MNERIKQLINECTTQEKGPPNYDLTANIVFEQFDKEKFAELIVKECLSFTEPMPNSGDIDDAALEGATLATKEHFGIK